ncbi:MAG: hypothetical protein M3340_03790 [Actinomycetota bacterium]|nr:hypothetical protein [Actinomycetota bacterium]
MSLVDRIEAGAEAAGGDRSGREWVLEVVREAYLLHYGEPRAFEDIDDDLKLLGGDALYARGLSRLAAAGDLEAVAVLADLISSCARAESEGRPTDDLWAAAAARLARG